MGSGVLVLHFVTISVFCSLDSIFGKCRDPGAQARHVFKFAGLQILMTSNRGRPMGTRVPGQVAMFLSVCKKLRFKQLQWIDGLTKAMAPVMQVPGEPRQQLLQQPLQAEVRQQLPLLLTRQEPQVCHAVPEATVHDIRLHTLYFPHLPPCNSGRHI